MFYFFVSRPNGVSKRRVSKSAMSVKKKKSSRGHHPVTASEFVESNSRRAIYRSPVLKPDDTPPSIWGRQTGVICFEAKLGHLPPEVDKRDRGTLQNDGRTRMVDLGSLLFLTSQMSLLLRVDRREKGRGKGRGREEERERGGRQKVKKEERQTSFSFRLALVRTYFKCSLDFLKRPGKIPTSLGEKRFDNRQRQHLCEVCQSTLQTYIPTESATFLSLSLSLLKNRTIAQNYARPT